MKAHLFAILTLLGVLCLPQGVWGQTVPSCDRSGAAVCTTRSGGEWFWVSSRLTKAASSASHPRQYMNARTLPPLTADNWTAGIGNWNVAGNWSAGIPNSSDAVTIGNGGNVTMNVAGATAGTLTISNGSQLGVSAGDALTVSGASTNTASYLYVGTSGGSTLSSGGSFTNTGQIYVGAGSNTTASTLSITGTFANTGGYLEVQGGQTTGGASLVNISGAAPSALLGTYTLISDTGAATVEFGSGSITSIGTSSTVGSLTLNGAKAYMAVGGSTNENALSGLNTIAYNGYFYLYNGVSLTTTTALTNEGGYFYIDQGATGGSSVTIGGNLTNNSSGQIQIGNNGSTLPTTLKVQGTVADAGGSISLTGGSASGANALLNVTGAAPGTLYGTYRLMGDTGSAAVEWGSGTITAIGDSSTTGSLTLNGPNAYMQIGATNNESALTSLNSIGYDSALYFYNGAKLTTTNALANNGGYLYLDQGGSGGSVLTVGGSLTNDDTGIILIGNTGMTSAANIKVEGTLANSGGAITVAGGSSSSANSLLNVTGAAPSTLYGTFDLIGSTGSAAVEYGSGAITALGDSSATGSVTLNGANAYMEIGATNSESALTSLNTIGYNSALMIYNGVSLTTSGALANNGGYLYVDDGGNGGSTLTVGGALTNENTGIINVGNSGDSLAATLKVNGTLTNSGGSITVAGGATTAAKALLNVTGAAPSTLLGSFDLVGNTGQAAVEFGSGAITSIGNSTTTGSMTLNGPNAYMEIGATNSESALASLTTINEGSIMALYNGASLTTTGGLTNNDGFLDVDSGGIGGSKVTIGGSLVNAGTGYVEVGNLGIGSATTLKVNGTLTNTGSSVFVYGGDAAGANSLVNVTGAAPATLTGSYTIEGNTGSAAVEFGSGAVTSIGDGSSNLGSVILNGANAYMETGATNSDSALTSLTKIATNGYLYLYDGASLTTTKALTNAGTLQIDYGGIGGSTFTSSGTLTNSGNLYVGSTGIAANGTLNTKSTVTNSATGTIQLTGSSGTGEALWDLTGATLSNSGTITLTGYTGGAEMEIGANMTISGKGTIQLSNATTNLITGSAGTITLTNGSTIEGAGTLSNMGIVNTGTISANQSTPLLILPSSLGINNQGTLSVTTGDTMQIGTAAGGALKNFSGTTLTGGTYSVGGTMKFGASGASIVTDAASISLTGAGAQLINFGGTSLLTNLATITSAGSFSLGTGWGTFTTTGNFTNNGTLAVGSGDKFIVNLADSLTNFSGTTLNSGTYNITGTLQFAGANIVTNDANITLTSAASKIDGNGNTNGLANFAVNNGQFILGKSRSFTTAGNFTNNGYLSVATGDTFDVNGNLTNFSGTTLTGGNYKVSGTLQFNGASIATNAATITLGSSTAKIVNQSAVNALAGFKTNTSSGSFTLSGNAFLNTTGGSFANAGTVTINTGSTLTIGGSSFNYTQTAGTTTVDGTLQSAGAGSLSLTGGNLYGTGALDYGVSDSATITPGNSASSTGKLQVNGTYAQNSTGALDVTIGGTTAGTKYDQLNVSGTASLNGTLNISLASGYTPTVGNTFDILNASSVTGSFSTVNGVSINGSEHFTVTTVSGDEIVLTVVSGAASTDSTSLTTSAARGAGHGQYGSGIYRPARIPVSAAPVRVAGAAPFGPTPVGGMILANRGFHAMDDFGTPVAAPGAGAAEPGTAAVGISAVSAASYNSMASMNHMRFECGVDLGALRHAGGKRLLRALWASPDSAEALSIGYMMFTTTH